MFEKPGLMLRISLQRFAQFATGRIRRGGHDSAIYDHNRVSPTNTAIGVNLVAATFQKH